MKRHRRKCGPWQERPDPRGLTIARRRASKRENAIARGFTPCPVCDGRDDHHGAECPHSQGEALRREALMKTGIPFGFWDAFFKALKAHVESRH